MGLYRWTYESWLCRNSPREFYERACASYPGDEAPGWDDIDWWNHVNNRIYYFFHRASDKCPRKPCFAEWPGPIPPRPVKATTAPDVAAPPIPEELPLVAEGKGEWARLRGVFKGDQGDNLGPDRDSETPPKEMR
jgi:hypothetical protein